MQIDEAVRRVRPDGWRDVQPREQIIRHALYDILKAVATESLALDIARGLTPRA